MCSLIIEGSDEDKATDKEYFDLLSRGGLTVRSRQMVEFVCAYFAILEYADQFIVKKSWIHSKSVSRKRFWEYILQNIVLHVNTSKKDLYLQ